MLDYEKIEEFEKQKTKVFKYIMYKKRTEQEIRNKFRGQIHEDMLEDIIEYLKEAKYIDDYDFVERQVNEYMILKTMSIKEIKYKLYAKGIDKKIIEKYSEDIPDLENLLNENINKSNELRIYKELKRFSNNKITEIINNNQYLKEVIFNGYHIYEEPYSASYFYKGDNIKKLTYIPFTVTTGSGRSKGNFTIVLKPKNETIK